MTGVVREGGVGTPIPKILFIVSMAPIRATTIIVIRGPLITIIIVQ